MVDFKAFVPDCKLILDFHDDVPCVDYELKFRLLKVIRDLATTKPDPIPIPEPYPDNLTLAWASACAYNDKPLELQSNEDPNLLGKIAEIFNFRRNETLISGEVLETRMITVHEAQMKKWDLVCTASNCENGYFGYAIMNKDRNQMLVAHRGTNDLKGVIADIECVMRNGYTPQIKSACTFVLLITSAMAEGVALRAFDTLTLSISGHSLGGWLSQISTYAARYIQLIHTTRREFVFVDEYQGCHAHCVSFDSPGAYAFLHDLDRFLRRQAYYPQKSFDMLDITELVGLPNAVNICNLHCGGLYAVDFGVLGTSEYQQLDPSQYRTTVFAVFNYTKQTHDIKNFVYAFSENSKIFRVKDWPKVAYPQTKSDTNLKVRKRSLVKPLFTVLTNPPTELEEWFSDRTKGRYNVESEVYPPTRISFNVFNADEYIYFERVMQSQIVRRVLGGVHFECDPDTRWLIEFRMDKLNLVKRYFDTDLESRNKLIYFVKKYADEDCSPHKSLKEFATQVNSVGEIMFCSQSIEYFQELKSSFELIDFEITEAWDPLRTVLERATQDNGGPSCLVQHAIVQFPLVERINLKEYSNFVRLQVISFLNDVLTENKFDTQVTDGKLGFLKFGKPKPLMSKVNLVAKMTKILIVDVLDETNAINLENIREVNKFIMDETKGHKVVIWATKYSSPSETVSSDSLSTFEIKYLTINLTLALSDSGFSQFQTFPIRFFGKESTMGEIFKKLEGKEFGKYFGEELSVFMHLLQKSDSLVEIGPVDLDTSDLSRKLVDFKENVECDVTYLEELSDRYASDTIFVVVCQNVGEGIGVTKNNIFLVISDEQTRFRTIYNDSRAKFIYKLEFDNSSSMFKFKCCYTTSIYIRRTLRSADIIDSNFVEESHQIKVIVDEPGMGKTATLTKMFRDLVGNGSIVDKWVVKADFKQMADRNIPTATEDEYILTFLSYLSNIDPSNNQLAFICLKYRLLSQPSSILLFLDGFDEIPKDDVRVKIVRILVKLKSLNVKMIITTRHHDLNLLVDNLTPTVYSFVPLTPQEQAEFLTSYWEGIWRINQGLQLGNQLPSFNNEYATEVISNTTSKLNNERLRFLGVPLQLRILAELSYRNSGCRLLSFCQAFTDTKYSIYFNDKLSQTREVVYGSRTDSWIGVNYKLTNAAVLELLYVAAEVAHEWQELLRQPDLALVNLGQLVDLFLTGIIFNEQGNRDRMDFIHGAATQFYVSKLVTLKMKAIVNDSKGLATMYRDDYINKLYNMVSKLLVNERLWLLSELVSELILENDSTDTHKIQEYLEEVNELAPAVADVNRILFRPEEE